MSAKHTPGPWTPAMEPETERIYIHAGPTEIARLASSAALPDASLISAAPELLEALHEVLAAHQREDPHHEDMCSNCKKARAAIAKATGSDR